MPTFRSDVVGSLLRPDSLKEARAALEAGRMTPAAFKQAEDRAVDEAIALQENAGLSVVTDGELRRDRKSTRLNSSHVSISYAVFCLKKKKKKKIRTTIKE